MGDYGILMNSVCRLADENKKKVRKTYLTNRNGFVRVSLRRYIP
jgi:hypothetical protein